MDFVGIAFNAMKHYLPFLFALCFHEFAHAWVARLRGDRTAEIMGRLTLNPTSHADIIGTVVFPLIAIVSNLNGVRAPMLGWAKPVPVDERNLKDRKHDMFLIASAGPLSNLLLALIGAVGLGLYARFFGSDILQGQQGAKEILEVFNIFIGVNVVLAIFNLLPFHPLDGGKVLARFLPNRVNDKIESYASYTSMILIVLFISGGLSVLHGPINWVSGLFFGIAQGVAS